MMSSVELRVVGRQKVDARMPSCSAPSVRSPAAMPLSLMHCAPADPKAPAVFCAMQATWVVHVGGFRHVQSAFVLQGARLSMHIFAGQKLPAASVRVAIPVVSGKVKLCAVWNWPPPLVGGQS